MTTSTERPMQPRDQTPLKIAMIGTRGVPAAYGGFETAVEEIGQRLVAVGHTVTVYCRSTPGVKAPKIYRGMHLVHLPAIKSKTLETLSHTFLSLIHLLLNRRPDAALVFNAANSPFLPLLRLKRVPVAVHVDGLEWKRGKWGRVGRKFYRIAEQIAVRQADALIADASGIADYYSDEFGAATELLTYGTKLQLEPPSDRLSELGLSSRAFHLVVARFERENHVDVIVEGYAASAAVLPLIIVGSAPYAAEYTNQIQAIADADPRITTVGGIWDQELLDQLYGNALTYIHGHSVGGTNPSLLRALGAGTSVIAWDVGFNREVTDDDERVFSDQAEVARLVERAELEPEGELANGDRLRARAMALYDWNAVAAGYEDLARRMAAGSSTRGNATGRRRANGGHQPRQQQIGN